MFSHMISREEVSGHSHLVHVRLLDVEDANAQENIENMHIVSHEVPSNR